MIEWWFNGDSMGLNDDLMVLQWWLMGLNDDLMGFYGDLVMI